MDDHAKHLHALCGIGGPHCDCCNDTSPPSGRSARKRRQRARKALAGVIRARMKREGAAEALEGIAVRE